MTQHTQHRPRSWTALHPSADPDPSTADPATNVAGDGRLDVRADVFSPPPVERRLPIWQRCVSRGQWPAWFFVSAHGNSGVSLLSRLSARQPSTPGMLRTWGVAVSQAWPNPLLEPTAKVVVVAQSSMYGLAWARDVAAQFVSGYAPAGTIVLGLACVRDQPGRLPKPIEASRGVLEGIYPRIWDVPYVPEYRLLTGLPGEACPQPHPGVDAALNSIRGAVIARGRAA
jgi:hypothetical protein